MEVVISLVVGVLVASGVWLVLRPRTFQVLVGLSLLSYATNLFIFSVGSLAIDMEPIVRAGVPADLLHYTDPIPQSLVLTAIVISFATTALFLVVLLALRGLTDSDHVDGEEREEIKRRLDEAGVEWRERDHGIAVGVFFRDPDGRLVEAITYRGGGDPRRP